MMRAFGIVAAAALALGLIGLHRLEPRPEAGPARIAAEMHTFKQLFTAITDNPTGKLFFVYLVLLLAAILGQDVLLEPFAAEAFALTVQQTTRITSLWGTFVLAAIILAGMLEGRVPKRVTAQAGNLGALAGFLVILASGWVRSTPVFYAGVTLLGLGTGFSTVANLSLMFDFTTPQNVGLYIGAWGVANSMSRLTGSVLAGALRDGVTRLTGMPLGGYLTVFGVEALMLLAAALMLARLDVSAFRHRAQEPSFMEKVAVAADG
jgi:BCD family chlorophyll transporter-like MFS transporter